MPTEAAGRTAAGRRPPRGGSVEDIELDLLVEAVFREYGYDFRHYVRSFLKRRVTQLVRQEGLSGISELQGKVLHDGRWAEKLMGQLTVNYTEMFRDPAVFRFLRENVLPEFASYPFLRVWHAGISTGEEAYALAVILCELGLYRRARIYATDVNDKALQAAREGIYPLRKMRSYTKNYIAAGGGETFSRYYVAKFNAAALDAGLKKNITFSRYNLATDSPFNVFNLILCRNVTIYFDDVLAERVHKLLYDSLELRGVLVLGHNESPDFTPYKDKYESLDRNLAIFRKIA